MVEPINLVSAMMAKQGQSSKVFFSMNRKLKISNLLLVMLIVLAIPVTLTAVRVVNDMRSKAYDISDARNPCYPDGCTVLADGKVIKPEGTGDPKEAPQVKCGDAIALDCTEIIDKNDKKWWNPLTWF